jgi:hypothetical protein
MERAHSNPAVLALWASYAAACDYVPLATLSESSTQFASLTPLELLSKQPLLRYRANPLRRYPSTSHVPRQ